MMSSTNLFWRSVQESVELRTPCHAFRTANLLGWIWDIQLIKPDATLDKIPVYTSFRLLYLPYRFDTVRLTLCIVTVCYTTLIQQKLPSRKSPSFRNRTVVCFTSGYIHMTRSEP